ncbi:SDR family NAD(P)-dependent oxidoreductase [Limnoglobus roseus]|uniref:KR domain-containing protein n=1 Tax=Limnoglobus roseus TaxID=2598579 RepID=A0A5C1ARF9_9BACT|nr:SDR family oxidoreductase [Limnoglobus roseus]QEL19784.1 KR domain-containing protein [Limnoglobus roseus]
MAETTVGGKVALVTGASSGIGRATAIRLAEAGADVALNYFSLDEEAESAAAAIRKLGRKAMLLRVDVSRQDAVEQMVADIVRELGRLDVFVSSAVYSDREPFTTANMDGFRRTIDVSMWGAFYGLRAASNQMLRQKQGGAAVIVGSPHAQIAFPQCMAYNMAKAALDQMAKTAACELLPEKIRVNVVYPGWTDTPGERKFFTDEMLKKAAAQTPMGRLATAEEIAEAVHFLVNPVTSSYITGTVLHVDGGLFLPWWSRRGSGDL